MLKNVFLDSSGKNTTPLWLLNVADMHRRY